MFLHLNKNTTLWRGDIIGVFDMDTATQTATGREFLQRAQKEGRLITAVETFAIPKSFIVTADGKVVISQLAPSVIRYRK